MMSVSPSLSISLRRQQAPHGEAGLAARATARSLVSIQPFPTLRQTRTPFIGDHQAIEQAVIVIVQELRRARSSGTGRRGGRLEFSFPSLRAKRPGPSARPKKEIGEAILVHIARLPRRSSDHRYSRPTSLVTLRKCTVPLIAVAGLAPVAVIDHQEIHVTAVVKVRRHHRYGVAQLFNFAVAVTSGKLTVSVITQ